MKSREKTTFSDLYKRYFPSLLFRLLFVVESVILIHFAICIHENFYFLLLVVFVILIIVDGFYVVCRRNGLEHDWISISLLSYTCVYVITVWVLVFYKFNLNDTMCKTTLLKTLRHRELCLQKEYSVCVLLDLFVQIVLICFAFGRWNMRIANLDREAHVEMVIMLICACSDCSDFFNYINAPHVKDHLGLVVLILTVFTLSIFQFSITLTRHKDIPNKSDPNQSRINKLLEILFCTKIWSILFLMFTQDLPYLLVRLVLLGTANLHLDRTIYLFLVKNMLLVYFDMYQIYYIYKKYNKYKMDCLTRVDMFQLVKNASGKTCLPSVDSE